MHFVYLLKSSKDNNYYIGQTKDLKKRLSEHKNGLVKSTKFRRPLSLIGFKKYCSQNKARWVEYSLKKSAAKRKKFIFELSPSSSAD